MASVRFALIQLALDFTLVPWRPVLDRHVGKPVSGIMRESGINWTLGRQRSGPSIRSEEHTSELQSLMRISYAVFCLKKKNKKKKTHEETAQMNEEETRREKTRDIDDNHTMDTQHNSNSN